MLQQTDEDDVLAQQPHRRVQRMRCLALQHLVQQVAGHVLKVLRRQIVPVAADQSRAVLQQTGGGHLLGHTVEANARAHADGGDERSLAEAQQAGQLEAVRGPQQTEGERVVLQIDDVGVQPSEQRVADVRLEVGPVWGMFGGV